MNTTQNFEYYFINQLSFINLNISFQAKQNFMNFCLDDSNHLQYVFLQKQIIKLNDFRHYLFKVIIKFICFRHFSRLISLQPNLTIIFIILNYIRLSILIEPCHFYFLFFILLTYLRFISLNRHQSIFSFLIFFLLNCLRLSILIEPFRLSFLYFILLTYLRFISQNRHQSIFSFLIFFLLNCLRFSFLLQSCHFSFLLILLTSSRFSTPTQFCHYSFPHFFNSDYL